MAKIHFTNARIVLADETLNGASVLVEDGRIQAIDPDGAANGAAEVDLTGRTLMAGMIDLHCDALEKEVEPRHGVLFPMDFACAQADKRNAAAGITTVYHALSFANEELGMRNNETAAQVARSVHAWQTHALVDNRVHCRYEVTDDTALPILFRLLEHGEAHLISVMDHTPGQGQFKDIAAYRHFLARNYRKTGRDFDRLMARKIDAGETAAERMRQLIEKAHAHGVRVASHDDDSVERLDTMQAMGVGISEFPINLETARAAHERGMATIFGAPNVLRGRSQSGSMRALDGVKAGVADCLCADYAPATLIVALFRLLEQTSLELHEAARLVTTNPARAAGLADRGEIAEGKRADLIAVSHLGGLPQVSEVWIEGTRVLSANFDHA